MFPNLPLWLNLFLTVAAVIAILAGVFAFFKSSAGDRTLKLAAAEISLLNERDARRERDFQSCKERLAEQDRTISLLTDTVTGASAVRELAGKMQVNHEELVNELREVVKRLDARPKTQSRARPRTR